VRVWAREDGRFILRAALDSPQLLDPCLAPLCDGRVAFSDSRGIEVGAPQSDGTWRVDELISSYDFGINLIAPLGPARVAYLDGESRLRVVHMVEPDRAQVVDLDTGTAPISALAAVGSGGLAFGGPDGRLHFAREKDGTWQVEDISISSAVQLMAGSESYLATSHADNTLAIWHRLDTGFSQLFTEPMPAPLSALAIDDDGRFVAAAFDYTLMIGKAGTPLTTTGGPRRCVGLHWGEDGAILALDEDGRLTETRLEPNLQEVYLRQSAPGSIRPVFTNLNGPAGQRVALARGASSIDLDGEVVYLVRADVRALAAKGSTLFVGADALYMVDI
jgi:hypothetical protein